MTEKLNIYAANVTSQHGEDGILAYIIETLGASVIKSVCEFGAWDGIVSSNAYTLWHDHGWKAILIEGEPDKVIGLRENIKGFDALAIERFISIKGKNSLDEIFTSEGVSPAIGLLSIDIDSFDYHVWKHTDYVNPQIVVVEHNQNIPPDIEYYDPEDSVYLKCSAAALETLGKEKGFRLICCTRTNSIFIKEELFDASKFPDAAVSELFDYSDITPGVIFTGEDRNKYPVFSRRTGALKKFLTRLKYRVSSAVKQKKKFIPPTPEVARHIRKMGLDL